MNNFLLKRKLVLILFTTFFKHCCVFAKEDMKVIGNVRLKNLLGTVETLNIGHNNGQGSTSLTYHAYRGLPYAQAQRWQDPVVNKNLFSNDIYDATKTRSQCPQWTREDNASKMIGSEDCLFADLFIPQMQKNNGPLKIMVFFHGGGFIVNANKNFEPYLLIHFADEPVLVIQFHYRLSVFGYLSTGTKEIPGNYGPLDQIALLKWVQLYGKDFGGDTSDVTLVGSSIGGVSIHYLLHAKLARGLFHKVIIESGSAFCERSMVPNPLDIATQVGSKVGCPPSTPSQLSACLRSKSTFDLMNAAYSFQFAISQWSLPSVFGPVLDKHTRPLAFLLDHPENLPVVNQVPVIVGITKHEGLTAFAKLHQGYTKEQLNSFDFIRSHILPRYLNLIIRAREVPRNAFIDRLSDEVMNFYDGQFRNDTISTLVGILGDLWINTCHRKTIETLCSNNVPSVYAYLFTHHDAGISPSGTSKQIEAIQKGGINHPVLDSGVGHTEEVLYMWNNEKDLPKMGLRRNAQMSKMLSVLWTKFAYSKNLVYRNSDGMASTLEWNPICKNNKIADLSLPLQELNLDSKSLFPNYRLQETNFWWKIHSDTFSQANKKY